MEDGLYKRAVTFRGREDFELLVTSGLYERLTREGLLVAHREEEAGSVRRESDIFRVLVPGQIAHVSYPYHPRIDSHDGKHLVFHKTSV